MMIDYTDYSQFDKDVMAKLKKINEEIENEKIKDNADGDKITKLRFAQLLKGLELQYGVNF